MSVDDVGLIERCFEYGGVPGEREREKGKRKAISYCRRQGTARPPAAESQSGAFCLPDVYHDERQVSVLL